MKIESGLFWIIQDSIIIESTGVKLVIEEGISGLRIKVVKGDILSDSNSKHLLKIERESR